MAETVQQRLRELLEVDTVGVRHEERTWTWREHLAEAAAEAAAMIDLLDDARPPHVGTLLGNGPEMLRAMAAAGLGGYVLAGINDTRRGEGLAADVRRADCQVLLTDAEHLPLLDGLDLGAVRVIDVDTPAYADLAGAAGPLTALREVTASDTFMLIFTSGTSGDPKAVQVGHITVLFAGLMLAQKYEITDADTCYLSMPLFHSNAVLAGWSVALCGGAAMAPARFSASQFLADVRRYGATYMNYVGKPLAYVLATTEQPDDADNPLRVAFGNEGSDRDIAEFARRFDCVVWDGFGSTELAVTITREPGTPPGSIGMPADGVAIYSSRTRQECPRAVFDEHGALLNPEEAIGEIVNTTGGGYFQGYYNDPAANADRLREGMYWSGDLGYRDADGWIYHAGRTGDWMRVDGENLAAAPIERVLMRLEVLSRVAVYAVPDAQVGDQVMAAVVLRDEATLTPADLEGFLAAQADLSPKAWPRYVRIASDLPSTATNKVLKRELAAQGAIAGDGVLWVREERSRRYRPADDPVSAVG
ncbi:AMP-binding protein [Nocardioides sp. dk4132]|uniref:fatty-acid--CoA ligase FadD1 n=1 Tax=unclassified Nocardioides TaxID=2615069 RepID=UPI0012976246|nr:MULTISPECIES: fatty-acid--CoA ligase FadD1 [unclassified Nocardioides]MQW75041.1 AMP-binding protein [Nocardioides sp. dk4132]QGA07786.1 AMP-binding protein [Nocardioides sp. dk884]